MIQGLWGLVIFLEVITLLDTAQEVVEQLAQFRLKLPSQVYVKVLAPGRNLLRHSLLQLMSIFFAISIDELKISFGGY